LVPERNVCALEKQCIALVKEMSSQKRGDRSTAAGRAVGSARHLASAEYLATVPLIAGRLRGPR
jgi:hypothetical protein